MLGPEASAELGDRLVIELGELGSGGDEAALWAKRRLGEKNRLTASDARRVEEAFQAKLAGFGGPADEGLPASEAPVVSWLEYHVSHGRVTGKLARGRLQLPSRLNHEL